MGHARLAVEMLTTADEADGRRDRDVSRAAEPRAPGDRADRSSTQAIEQVTEHGTGRRRHVRASCSAAKSWHPGVIGIVASRIVDRFHRPAVMVALNNGHGQGSGRSIAGFHLARALDACAEHLEAYGGHEMAAGLKVQTENFEAFRDAFCEHASRSHPPGAARPRAAARRRRRAEHDHRGAGHTTCTASARSATATASRCSAAATSTLAAPPRRVGKTGDHLQLHVRQGDHFIKCIAFG